MKKVLFAFGTRPEAVKMAPLIGEMKRREKEFDVEVCVTAQHRQMLDQVLAVFSIVPDYDFDVMQPTQTLPDLTARILSDFDKVLEQARPDIVIVQGDTTTSFACALAAFYRKVRVAHLEAGLRTDNRYAPFPEEINRRMTSCLADWHFAPTERSRKALIAENYPPSQVFVTGNTVIDALFLVVEKVRGARKTYAARFPFIDSNRRMVRITGHRRESFGEGFEAICDAIRELAQRQPDVLFVYAVHLNPNVQEPVNRILTGIGNVHLIPPQDYVDFVWLMDRSHIILTDSGGIQEEAPSLGKPVVVMRKITERMEAVEAGVATLAGIGKNEIFNAVHKLLCDAAAYGAMTSAANPFGDGKASVRIADHLGERSTLANPDLHG